MELDDNLGDLRHPADALDPASSVPLHRQISTRLRVQIMNRSLPPGTQLPSEARLQDTYGVSRSVVRQALAALAWDGLIDRGRGRGSTVAPRPEHHRLVHRLPGLSTQIAREGAQVSTQVLSLAPEAVSPATAVLGGTEVLSLRRLRLVDGSPIALIQTWLPLPECASLTADELTDASLHAALRERYDIAIVAGTRQVRAVPAEGRVRSALDLAERDPVLLLEGTSVDEHGRAVEVFQTWHRADAVVFDIDVVREPAAALDPSLAKDADRFNGRAAARRPRPDRPHDGEPSTEDLALRARELSEELARFARRLGGDVLG